MSFLSKRTFGVSLSTGVSFSQWLRQQDVRFLMQAATLQSWLQALVGVTLLLFLLTQIQSANARMGLPFWTAWLCFLPAFLVGSLLHLKKKISPSDIAIYTLGTSAGVFFFCTSLMVLTKPGMGFWFGIFYLFAAAFYGWLLRARTQTPFPLLSLLVGTAAAWWLDVYGSFWLVASILLPFSLLVMLWLGGWRYSLDLEDKERESLRDAVFAQIQLEQSTQVEVFRRSLADILTVIHDLNNQIQAVMAGTYLLQRNAAEESVAQGTRETLDYLDRAVRSAVGISQILHQGRFGTHGRVHDLIHTDLLAAIREAVEAVQLLYPNVVIHTELPPSLPLLPMVGGEQTLQRIAHNLLLNACQGQDGRHGASVVFLRLRYDADERELFLEVQDNGQGLPTFLIEQGPALMVSTKGDAGTGLGLYSVNLLARANCGGLCLANHAEGGALITVNMRVLPEQADEEAQPANTTNTTNASLQQANLPN